MSQPGASPALTNGMEKGLPPINGNSGIRGVQLINNGVIPAAEKASNGKQKPLNV